MGEGQFIEDETSDVFFDTLRDDRAQSFLSKILRRYHDRSGRDRR